MENREDSCTSFPYIDDATTDDESNSHQYNLRITENYHYKNRNIEITNRFPNDASDSLSPVAPLADESEFNDEKLNEKEENPRLQMRNPTSRESGMKLVIKGWNSSISIQGLDNKSCITFKRRCDKLQKNIVRQEGTNKPACEEVKPVERSRKGRWKMLTKSIMLARSARFERRGLDERYPKYVLLKNEEEEAHSVKENYPKMFVFDDKSSKQKPKPEFSFKKSFKNKTEPMVPVDEILAKTNENAQPNVKKHKKPLTERNLKFKKKITLERRKSISEESTQTATNVTGCHVYNEIQDIFEDTLKLLPQGAETQQSENVQRQHRGLECYTSVPPHFCQFSCQDPYCCLPPHGQSPEYFSIYNSRKEHPHKNSNTQPTYQNQETTTEERNESEEVDLGNFPFGILSSFFPRVVIMNTISNDDFRGEEETSNTANETEFKNYLKTERVKDLEKDATAAGSLEVPQKDLTLKSKMIVKPNSVTEDFFLGNVNVKEFPSLGEEQKEKSQDSEATEYLQYTEFDPPGNESVEPADPMTSPPPTKEMSLPPAEKQKAEDLDENTEDLSLTKIGYKMYDNLTKLSLNRKKEITEKPEASGCGCNGSETKKSPYNITLESNNNVVKVTVPENELNFQIVNSTGGNIQIGVTRNEKGKDILEEKKTVRKEELWHSDDDRRALVLHSGRGHHDDDGSSSNSKGVQKLKVSLADNRQVVLSIEMNEKGKREEKPQEKSTKEMKVGTDDFDLAGGDFVCALDGNYKNLSPRLGKLLKHLHEKLEIDQKERKFLDDKINQKLLDQKFQTGTLPGLFLVKHVSPREPVTKKPTEISFRKPKKEIEGQVGGLREYYCEECLATMRIFEDENPSVKSMVDKFETIIQLESY